MIITETIAKEFGIRLDRVENIIKLIDEGCTIPCIMTIIECYATLIMST